MAEILPLAIRGLIMPQFDTAAVDTGNCLSDHARNDYIQWFGQSGSLQTVYT